MKPEFREIKFYVGSCCEMASIVHTQDRCREFQLKDVSTVKKTGKSMGDY